MRKLKVLGGWAGFSNFGEGRLQVESRRECTSPLARPTTLAGMEARLHWPFQFAPHAAMVPSALRARLWAPPPATATTLLSPSGTLICPWESSPHATTVPLVRNARL